MRILGIIGRPDTTECHDGAAAIIEDGQIVVAIEQERLSRIKHAPGQAPVEAVLTCLRQTQLTLDDIDYIAYGWLESLIDPITKLSTDIVSSRELTTLLLPQEVFGYSKIPIIYFVRHHLAHMAASYFTSGFSEAAGLIIDGQGENESISLYRAQRSEIKCVKTYEIKCSLGLFYEAAGYYSGLGWDAPGKFMGLSAYGKPSHIIELDFIQSDGEIILPPFIRKRIELEKSMKSSNEISHLWIEYFKNYCYPYEIGFGYDIMSYQDYSASIQRKLEEIACGLVQTLKKHVNSDNLVMGGGVSLNCSMNEAIGSSGFFKNLFVFPGANDAGSSVGAALALYYHLNPNNLRTNSKINGVSFGRHFQKAEIEEAFRKCHLEPKFLSDEILVKKVAQDLTNDLVIGWFQGRDEFGPRALGNRSILVNPRNRRTLYKLNRIKGREIWRPLAPSILSEYVGDVFETELDPNLSRFMLTFGCISEKWRHLIPVVVHSDFTTRPHVVHKVDTPLYWMLIETFRKNTNIPLVCNTSFNVANYPIVHTPEDAINVYLNNEGIDTLVIGGFYISKR